MVNAPNLGMFCKRSQDLTICLEAPTNSYSSALSLKDGKISHGRLWIDAQIEAAGCCQSGSLLTIAP